MKRKNILLTIGSLASVSLPLIAAVSCGTSWHQWNKDDSSNSTNLKQDPTKSNIDSYNPNKPKDNSTDQNTVINTTKTLFATRDIAELKAVAYDSQTNEINLNEVNNQFELNKLLIDILGMRAPESIENYWKSSRWSDFSNYINDIKETQDIKVKFTDNAQKPHEFSVKWDISSSKPNIKNGLSTIGHFADIETQESKFYDSKKFALTDEGFLKAADAAVDLIDIPIVKSITSINRDYSMRKLALLVNIPPDAFNAFKDLLNDISSFTGQLFNVSADTHLFTNETIKTWINEKHLNPKIKITNIDENANYPNGLIEAAFLLQSISRDYDELGK